MQFYINKEPEEYSVVFLKEIGFELEEKYSDFKMHKFEAKIGQIIYVSSIKTSSIKTWFVGAKDVQNYLELGAFLYKILNGKNVEAINLDVSCFEKKEIKKIVFGLLLRDYEYLEYKEKKASFNLKKINVCKDDLEEIDFELLIKRADAVKKARDLVNAPANEMVPLQMAQEIEKWLVPLGVNVKILQGDEIKKMGLLVGVGQASINKPCVVVMEYNANFENLTALVGKGVTYDTGGTCLKSGNYMYGMKADMAGAAVVAGSIAAIAQSGLEKKGVIGIVGLVENAIGGNAIKPDDILYSYSGKTVEIVNTDAEGRLVLADLISYVQSEYNLSRIFDFATLTGAISIALGDTYAGVYCNNDEMFRLIQKASNESKELVWRMPLHDDYRKALDSEIADYKNFDSNVVASSNAAASFIEVFVEKDLAWAHFDIAGVSFLKKEGKLSPYGATGFGVCLVAKFIKFL